MHVRVRFFGKPEAIVVVESKLTKIEKLRGILKEKFDIEPKLQRLFYGGKLLENGYTFHDYNIKINDVIQLMVRIQPAETADKEQKEESEVKEEKSEEIKVEYKDATSKLYAVGDLIDMRDREQGAWFEGTIQQIVRDPNAPITDHNISLDDTNTSLDEKQNGDNDLENKPPDTNSKPKRGIAKYFSKTPKIKIKSDDLVKDTANVEENLLFKVKLVGEEDESYYCKLKEIRPRARTVIDVKHLKIGQKVMLNHNTEEVHERGYWYDFKVSEIKKQRISYELIGTLFLGPDAVPQNDTKVKVQDKIYAIEEVVPIAKRTDEYKKMMATPMEKRSLPLNCLTCRDDEDALCKDCGCYICSGKEFPEKIVLCDECNKGFHMGCLKPPLKELPDEDWYCPTCKRNPNDVIAPGAAKQTKKAGKSNRDWGRGMACVGKTKTCAMPANHFGPIPGIEVGMCWRFRIQPWRPESVQVGEGIEYIIDMTQITPRRLSFGDDNENLSESGVHRPPVSGIHGRDVDGAYSIVLSGGYEDDVDHGNEFTYTGSGGRDLSGNKRTAEQSCDQTLTRENKALARNCAVKQINEEGGDAGDDWRSGKPVRVVRSYKMMKHFPKYAPKEGIRYDGIYKVVKYYPEKGLSGYRVWKYLLRRDDPNPAPWEPGAKQFSIVYPDGYLEAEAEKKALKEKNSKSKSVGKGKKKRALRESNHSTDNEDSSPPSKKRKANTETKRKTRSSKSPLKSPKTKSIKAMFTIGTPRDENDSQDEMEMKSDSILTKEEADAINADTVNGKLWDECLVIGEKMGKKSFIEHVTQIFLCIICQEVAANPVTTPCQHNFCITCLKQAFKTTSSLTCPCCRNNLSKYEPETNEELKLALRIILPGYDAGKK